MPDAATYACCRQALGQLVVDYGCRESGILFFPAERQPPATRRTLDINGLGTLHIDHDERDAPVVAGTDGWDDRLLISLTDEGGLATCAWARIDEDSSLLGIGVDLAHRSDFAGKRGEQFNHLILTDRDLELVPEICADDHALGCAFAFSAKEAAFKSCAAPLRTWYRSHDEELLFDLTSFQLADTLHEVGTARRGEAQRAMELLGIDRIELARVELDDFALTFAAAIQEH